MLNQEYLLDIVVAAISLVAGLAATGMSFFRWRRKDVSLITFGAASVLYGVRLFVDTQLGQYGSADPPPTSFYFSAFCTYIVPIPLSGFILQLLGKGWRNSIVWSFRGSIAFACAAILSDIVQATPGSLRGLNNALVIIWACILFVNMFVAGQSATPELRVVLFGFLVFGLMAVNENLVSLDLVPWRWRWEGSGFLVFLGTLGYVAAKRFFSNEARLIIIERELEIARQIQSSILPRQLPVIHGLEMAARYVPMASVAGDFYDVLPQDEARLCILVADVSGHGVGAALIASMLKVAFASQQHLRDDPAGILRGINHSLSDKLEDSFITAGCLFVDTAASTMKYAGAGHPPMILHRKAESKLYELGSGGVLLGPFPDARYEATTMHIEPGDRLLLYTDGITESTDPSGAFFGDASFRAFIETHAQQSAGVFVDLLVDHVTRWSHKDSHESLDDDLTLVVVDVL